MKPITINLRPVDPAADYPTGEILICATIGDRKVWHVCTVDDEGYLLDELGSSFMWMFSDIDGWCPIQELTEQVT